MCLTPRIITQRCGRGSPWTRHTPLRPRAGFLNTIQDSKGKKKTTRNVLPPQIVFLAIRFKRPSRSVLRRSLQLRPGMEPEQAVEHATPQCRQTSRGRHPYSKFSIALRAVDLRSSNRSLLYPRCTATLVRGLPAQTESCAASSSPLSATPL